MYLEYLHTKTTKGKERNPRKNLIVAIQPTPKQQNLSKRTQPSMPNPTANYTIDFYKKVPYGKTLPPKVREEVERQVQENFTVKDLMCANYYYRDIQFEDHKKTTEKLEKQQLELMKSIITYGKNKSSIKEGVKCPDGKDGIMVCLDGDDPNKQIFTERVGFISSSLELGKCLMRHCVGYKLMVEKWMEFCASGKDQLFAQQSYGAFQRLNENLHNVLELMETMVEKDIMPEGHYNETIKILNNDLKWWRDEVFQVIRRSNDCGVSYTTVNLLSLPLRDQVFEHEGLRPLTEF